MSVSAGNFVEELKKGIRVTFPNTDFTNIDHIDFDVLKPETKTITTFSTTLDTPNKKAYVTPLTSFFTEIGYYYVHPKLYYSDGTLLKGNPVRFKVNNEFELWVG